MMEFEKFSKVTRISNAINDGKFPSGTYSVTEKLDGANAGILRVKNGFILHSRNTGLAFLSARKDMDDNIENGFNGFVNYVKEKLSELAVMMDEGDHIYGEWLIPHTISYPVEMYRKFYAFDEMDEWWPFEEVSRLHSMKLKEDEISLETLNKMAEGCYSDFCKEVERDVEGIVLKHEGSGERFKYVSPKFSEVAGTRWNVKKQLAAAETEVSMAAMYSPRSFEKILEKVQDLEGGLNRKHTPQVLGRAWADYCEEFLADAIKKHRFPTVDTKRLKMEVDNRNREMFFTKLDTGAFPQWAQHRIAKEG